MASISRPSTTIKVSVETRDRIRDLGGGTLDALETYRFWAQAEAAAAWRALLPEDERQRRREQEIAIDAALDRLW
jgi:hypothetical protein